MMALTQKNFEDIKNLVNSACALGYKSLFDFTWYPKKFQNCHHTTRHITNCKHVKTIFYKWKWTILFSLILFFPTLFMTKFDDKGHNLSQCAEGILNKIAKPWNKNFAGLICMPQGFTICFIWYPRLEGTESTC